MKRLAKVASFSLKATTVFENHYCSVSSFSYSKGDILCWFLNMMSSCFSWKWGVLCLFSFPFLVDLWLNLPSRVTPSKSVWSHLPSSSSLPVRQLMDFSSDHYPVWRELFFTTLFSIHSSLLAFLPYTWNHFSPCVYHVKKVERKWA